MSESRTISINFFPWLVIFLIVKLGGTALANWSWLWVLLPVVPVCVMFLQKAGLL
jgi:hypothetical protein